MASLSFPISRTFASLGRAGAMRSYMSPTTTEVEVTPRRSLTRCLNLPKRGVWVHVVVEVRAAVLEVLLKRWLLAHCDVLLVRSYW